jgi:hypothetical protein
MRAIWIFGEARCSISCNARTAMGESTLLAGSGSRDSKAGPVEAIRE